MKKTKQTLALMLPVSTVVDKCFADNSSGPDSDSVVITVDSLPWEGCGRADHRWKVVVKCQQYLKNN